MAAIQMRNPAPSTVRSDQEYLRQNNAPNNFALLGTLGSIALIIVALRLYVRLSILRSIGVDDYTIIVATLMGIGMFICFVGETYHGLGRHYEVITPSDIAAMLKWVFAHSICATLALCLTKMSVGFFLLRLATVKSWRVFLWFSIAFLAAYTAASIRTIIFACVPVEANWDLELAASAKCFSHKTFVDISLWNADILPCCRQLTGVFTDLLFASLPIPIILQLQLSARTKAALAAVLGLGYLASAAGAAKIYFLLHYFEDPDHAYYDWFFVLAGIELYIGILSASLPALRRLTTSCLKRTRTYFSVSRRSRSRGVSMERRDTGGYQRQSDWESQLELRAVEPATMVSFKTDVSRVEQLK